MTTIGLIGSGHIGTAIARQAITQGHDVVLSNSRGPDTLADLVAELGPHASAATAAEAGAAGDVVVVTVPFKNYLDVPVEPLGGKIVIDTNNYYFERDGRYPELDEARTSVSEMLAAHLPTSHVVKAFNAIQAAHIVTEGKPVGDPDRRALAIAGDDETAKQVVARLIESFGFDVLDAGPLAEGKRFDRDTPAYGAELGTEALREAVAAG